MTDDARAISALIRGIYDDFQAHRPGGIEARLHPDATIWDVFQPDLIRGRAARDRFHAEDQAQMQARGPLSLTVSDPLIDVWGEAAVARYRVDFRYQPPNPAEGSVRITSVLRRMHDGWRILHHHEGLAPTGHPPIADSEPAP